MTTKNTARHWCFTAFEEVEIGELPNKVRYLIVQKEQCPETKKIHWQGYIELTDPVRFTGVQKIIGSKAHCEQRRGTRQEARAYCMKKESQQEPPKEWGIWNEKDQGNRSDLQGAIKAVESGGMKQAAEEFPEVVVKHYKGLIYYNNVINKEEKDREIEVHVFWGPAGTGKTRTAYDFHRGELYKLDLSSGQVPWFDGYDGEKVLLIDDFDGTQLKHQYLLHLLDRYPLQLQIKGGTTWAKWTTVIITSNKDPEIWFKEGLTDALRRRLHFVTCHEVTGNTRPSPRDTWGDTRGDNVGGEDE